MNKFKWTCFAFTLSVIALNLEAAPVNNQPARPNMNTPQANNQSSTQQKDEIMRRDQMDDTDTFAIPLDSSEVEDEEEINRLEQKKVFNLGR